MVDGPPNVAPVSKRFEQLRAFQAASLEGTLPMEITTYSQGYGWYMYHNDIDLFGHNHVLKLSRPASAFTGIPEKDVGHLYLEDHPPDQDLSIGNSAVDCEQDLVVMTQVDPVECVPNLAFILNSGRCSRSCFFLSGRRACTSCRSRRKVPFTLLQHSHMLKAQQRGAGALRNAWRSEGTS